MFYFFNMFFPSLGIKRTPPIWWGENPSRFLFDISSLSNFILFHFIYLISLYLSLNFISFHFIYFIFSLARPPFLRPPPICVIKNVHFDRITIPILKSAVLDTREHTLSLSLALTQSAEAPKRHGAHEIEEKGAGGFLSFLQLISLVSSLACSFYFISLGGALLSSDFSYASECAWAAGSEEQSWPLKVSAFACLGFYSISSSAHACERMSKFDNSLIECSPEQEYSL